LTRTFELAALSELRTGGFAGRVEATARARQKKNVDDGGLSLLTTQDFAIR
jgi:hypothetical protein